MNKRIQGKMPQSGALESAFIEQEGIVVLCTCPDESTAQALAGQVVELRLAACVNILPVIRSVYRWQGKVVEEPEALMIIKTQRSRLQPLQEKLVQIHPYEVPEVIALDIAGGSRAYLDWLVSCVRPGSGL